MGDSYVGDKANTENPITHKQVHDLEHGPVPQGVTPDVLRYQGKEVDFNKAFGQQPVSNYRDYYSGVKGDPTSLGLLSFGMTTCMLSFVLTGWVEMQFTILVVAYMFFFGGFAQFVAGVLDFIRGNSFGGLIFCTYGAFWLGYGLYEVLTLTGRVPMTETPHGLTLFYVLWGCITFIFFITSFKARSWSIRAVLGLLCVTFILLAGGEWSNRRYGPRTQRAGGYFAFLTALAAMYSGLGFWFYDETKWRAPLL